jgi:hypothetical protein
MRKMEELAADFARMPHVNRSERNSPPMNFSDEEDSNLNEMYDGSPYRRVIMMHVGFRLGHATNRL